MSEALAGPANHTVSREGQVVAVLGLGPDAVSVQAAVYPRGKSEPVAAGPYRFASPTEARAFLNEALEALTYLGCECEATPAPVAA